MEDNKKEVNKEKITDPDLEVWVLNMPGTQFDKVEVVRKSEYDKLLKRLDNLIKV